MAREYRQTVVIGPGGTFEGCAPDLEPGTTAEVFVSEIAKRVSRTPKAEEREMTLRHMWELSDRAIAEGMETWDLDRVNAEVAERRGGDREVL